MRAWTEWLVWAVTAAAVVASFVYESTALADEVWCLFRRITDMACPGCGLTRAFCAMARLEVGAAFGHHLAGPWLWLTAVAAVIWHPLRAGMGWTTLWVTAPRIMNGWFMLFAALLAIHILRWALGAAVMMA